MVSATTGIGFVGLGVMGEPMCRNVARKSGIGVSGFDRDPAPLQRLAAFGVVPAPTLADMAANCDIIFLALPSGAHVEAVCGGDGGLLAHAGARHARLETMLRIARRTMRPRNCGIRGLVLRDGASRLLRMRN